MSLPLHKTINKFYNPRSEAANRQSKGIHDVQNFCWSRESCLSWASVPTLLSGFFGQMDFEIPKHLFHAADWRGVEGFLQSCRNISLEKVKQDLERYQGEQGVFDVDFF